MWFKFSKAKNKSVVAKQGMSRVIISVNRKLHQLSDYLQKQTNKLPLKTKRIGFLCFCLLFGTLSINVILKGFFQNKNSIPIRSITTPVVVGKSDDDLRDRNIISLNEFEHIEAFKAYMDSLKSSKHGRVLFDSVMNARPQLMDSILLLENLYEIQSLKK